VKASVFYRQVGRLLRQMRVYLKRYPVHSFILLSFLAPLGWLIPLLFPAFGFYSGGRMLKALASAPALSWPEILDWWPVLMWLMAVPASFWFGYRLLRVRTRQPEGQELTRSMAPTLYELVDELTEGFGALSVHRIIITGRFQLDVVKTQKFILPVASRNTLVIGLPLIQIMPLNIFRALLARKLSQHSLLRNPLLHFLHQMDGAWWQYYEAIAAHPAADMKLFALVYGIFAMLYHELVEPIARLDGLSADRFTLKTINDEDVVESIEYLFVAGMFIDKVFWPRLRSLARDQHKYDLSPCATLSRVRERFLERLDVDAWLHREMAAGVSPRWGVASMRDRLNTLGHDAVLALEIDHQFAAEAYLSGCLAQIISKVDRQWREQTIAKWQAIDERLAEEQALMTEIKTCLKTHKYGFGEWADCLLLAVALRKISMLPLLLKMLFTMHIHPWSRGPAVSS
jgi:hypothetical protein